MGDGTSGSEERLKCRGMEEEWIGIVGDAEVLEDEPEEGRRGETVSPSSEA